MNHNLNRRDFTKRTSAGVVGLFAGSIAGGATAVEPQPNPSDTRLVLLGLNALARAPELSYFADGHRGAALVAAQQMCVENGLDEPAQARIVELFELNWAKSALCKSFPETDARPAEIRRIGEAFAEGADVLREVGHNAIFAMLAIKAFRMLPDAATPERIDGVCRLMRSFQPRRDVEPDAAVDPPPFVESEAASRFVLHEADAAIDRFVGFGQGFAGHMLTFGHALVELAAMGDVEWAEKCRTAFRQYVTIVRRGPDKDARRIADHKRSDLRPKEAAYWKQRGDRAVDIGHVFKYPYSYYNLMRRANDPELKRTMDAKAWHLF
jgi:hypothetical protein